MNSILVSKKSKFEIYNLYFQVKYIEHWKIFIQFIFNINTKEFIVLELRGRILGYN